MFTETILGFVLLIGLLTADPSIAASTPGCPERVGGQLPATYQGLSAIAPGYLSAQCRSEECIAARNVECAMQAKDNDLMPNSMVYTPAQRLYNQRMHARVLQAFGTTHRDRWPLYCTMLASIAAHTTGGDSDGAVIEELLDLFTLMQPAPQGCGKRIKAAFPQIEAVQRQLMDGNAICLTDPRPCQPALPPRRRRP